MLFSVTRVSFLIAALLLVSGPALGQGDETDTDWPRKITTGIYEITIYQPQIESFVGDKLDARAAISVKEGEKPELIFGAMWFESRLETDLETRMATLVSTKVTASKFPDVDPARVDRLAAFLEQEIPTWNIPLSIDRLVASLPDPQDTDAAFGTEPPDIYHRTVPTVLVLIDGDPILTDLDGFELEYVANSAFFIVKDKKTGYYLRGSGMWFVSDDIGGTWKVTTDLPSEVAKVSQKVEEDEKKQAEEQKKDAENLGVQPAGDEPPPQIIVSTKPAELIVTEGDPDFASIEGTQLLYLKNTESDLIMDISSQQYFALVSGRWYRSTSLDEGAWEFTPFEDLPADFAQIPAGSDMASVLPSVPGTNESRDALLENQIPQTAEVDRKTATVEVTYDGDPEFEACGEGVAYALNTDKSVLLIDNKYYCVDSAVWFVSSGPTGPWAVATEVPAQVQDLPPDCPVYNVKYVYIYDSTPEVVYVGYTGGYYGSYAWGPCVIYGTGWYYHPWYHHYYYPRPVTYGFGVHYNPWTGWGFSFGVSYGWVTVGVGWGRPPYGCWGPAGYRYGYRHGYWHGYNHGYRHGYRRGAAAGYRAGYRAGQHNSHNHNIYRNRNNGVKKTGDLKRPQAKQPRASDNSRNNVYADKEGNIHRNQDGKWEERKDGKWKDESNSRPEQGTRDNPDRDKATRDQVDRDKAAQDKATRDKATRDKATREKATRDQANRDKAARDQADRAQRDRQQMDRSRQSQQQQLDRDRSSRQRGAERQRQAPRGGGGRRR